MIKFLAVAIEKERHMEEIEPILDKPVLATITGFFFYSMKTIATQFVVKMHLMDSCTPFYTGYRSWK